MTFPRSLAPVALVVAGALLLGAAALAGRAVDPAPPAGAGPTSAPGAGSGPGAASPPAGAPAPATAPAPKVGVLGPVDYRRPVRVFCDANPTPIALPWEGRVVLRSPVADRLEGLGCIPAFIASNGTFNNAPTWSDDEGNPVRALPVQGKAVEVSTANGVVWDRAGNHCDPVTARAARAVGTLAKRPHFYGARLKPYRPLFIDLEGTRTYNSTLATAEAARRSVQAYTDLADRLRPWIGEDDGELYLYAGHARLYFKQDDPELDRLEGELAKRLSGFCRDFYNWDLPAESDGDAWFAGVNRADALIERYYPQWRRSKVAFVMPVYTILWPQNLVDPRNKAKEGKPVPIELWKREIRYLVERGWDLYVWTGNAPLKGIEEHLDYVAAFAR